MSCTNILKFVCHHQYFIQTQLNEIHLPINFYIFYMQVMQLITLNKLPLVSISGFYRNI